MKFWISSLALDAGSPVEAPWVDAAEDSREIDAAYGSRRVDAAESTAASPKTLENSREVCRVEAWISSLALAACFAEYPPPVCQLRGTPHGLVLRRVP